MNCDNDELRATKGLAHKEFEEDILIKELQNVLEFENLNSDSRETIQKVIKVLGGE